jgi:hypothetical protein
MTLMNILFNIVVASVLSECVRASFKPAESYVVTFLGVHTITTFDGHVLHGDGFAPIPNSVNETFPVIIFPNSWGVPQFEYIFKNLQLAEEGYVAFEYETRGWYFSGGEIDCAGPLDRRDLSSIVDFVVSHAVEWHIDVSRIGFCGISYGAGLSLMAAAVDPRITAVASLSGWANLTLAMYDHFTPNKVWAQALLFLGELVGHLSPDVSTNINDLIAHRNLSSIFTFSEARSPGVNVSAINARKVPVLISNNYNDRLFQPNDMLMFFNKITSPKMILLNEGGHAEAELSGLLDLGKNYVWSKTKLWFQHFLQGVDNGIEKEAPVQCEVQYQGNDYLMYSKWPDDRLVQMEKRFLTPRAGNGHYGGLAPSHPPLRNVTYDFIRFDTLSGVYDGVPIVSDYLNQFVPTTNELSGYQEDGAIVYMNSPLTTTRLYCGTPEYQVLIQPTNVSGGAGGQTTRWQLYSLIYSVDSLDIGTIIADAYNTNWEHNTPWGSPNRGEVTVREDGSLVLRSNFRFMCQNVAFGSRIAVAFVLYNAAFQQSSTNLGMRFLYSEESWISLPYNP